MLCVPCVMCHVYVMCAMWMSCVMCMLCAPCGCAHFEDVFWVCMSVVYEWCAYVINTHRHFSLGWCICHQYTQTFQSGVMYECDAYMSSIHTDISVWSDACIWSKDTQIFQSGVMFVLPRTDSPILRLAEHWPPSLQPLTESFDSDWGITFGDMANQHAHTHTPSHGLGGALFESLDGISLYMIAGFVVVHAIAFVSWKKMIHTDTDTDTDSTYTHTCTSTRTHNIHMTHDTWHT